MQKNRNENVLSSAIAQNNCEDFLEPTSEGIVPFHTIASFLPTESFHNVGCELHWSSPSYSCKGKGIYKYILKIY